jgi:L-fucose isomerase-like protein
VNGLRPVRVGMVGARPNAFRTVRYSEKLLEAAGVTVNVIDLSDVYARAAKLADEDPRVLGKVGEIRANADTGSTPPWRERVHHHEHDERPPHAVAAAIASTTPGVQEGIPDLETVTRYLEGWS